MGGTKAYSQNKKPSLSESTSAFSVFLLHREGKKLWRKVERKNTGQEQINTERQRQRDEA